jgi:hypothetical protein
MTCTVSFVLPDDIVTIISEYSKPMMKFSSRYKKCMQELNRSSRMIGTIENSVKKRLCEKDAAIVIDAFEEYVVALLTTYATRQLLNIAPFGNDTLTQSERNELRAMTIIYAEIQHKKTLYLLDVLHKLEVNNEYEYEKRRSHFNRFENSRV